MQRIVCHLVVMWCGVLAACDAREGRRRTASSAGGDAQLTSDSVGVVLAAGDIAQCTPGASETARLLDTLPGTIVVVGDAAYSTSRNPNAYRTCFDSTWGRHRQRTYAIPGNHDAQTMNMYFDYFGAAAGPRPGGYYGFDVGPWHALALNSNIDMGPRSPQGKWAAADLAAHPSRCTIAFMHHPQFSSGPHHYNPRIRPMWRLLDSAGVDVVVSGHDHIYERFAPMHEDGRRDDRDGVRLFIAGMGGAYMYHFGEVARNSEERSNASYGLLRLTLHADRYEWDFVPAAPSEFHDAGSGTCH